MCRTKAPTSRSWHLLGILRLALGPPILIVIAETQGVRVTGVATVSLAHPDPHWRLAIADVLVALALGAFAFWTASSLARWRAPLSHFCLVVACGQLPLAAVALLVGRNVLGRLLVDAVGKQGEKTLLRAPLSVLSHLIPSAIAVLLVSVLVIGVLYSAYRRTTRLEGSRLALSFVGGLAGAELLCRLWAWWAG